MQVAAEAFKIAQHLKTRGTQTAGLHRCHRCGHATGVRDQIACHEHDLRKARVFHGVEFGFERTIHGDGVHAKTAEQIHHRLLHA